MEDFFDTELFISRNYVDYKFEYKGVEEVILHGESACTDYDLTGQIVWPSSQALSRYIINNPEVFKDKVVLELGAGAGLAGIVAANFAKEVILTDGVELVVQLLRENGQKTRHKQKVTVEVFEWRQHQQFFERADRSKINLVIGADIVFWPQGMQPLCQVIDRFIQKNNAECIIAVKNRSNNSQSQFESFLAKYNLERKVICHELDIPIYRVIKTVKTNSL